MCVFCKKTEFRLDNCGMLRTTRVQPNATGGKRSPGHFLLMGSHRVPRVEHSCFPNVDLNDQRRGAPRVSRSARSLVWRMSAMVKLAMKTSRAQDTCQPSEMLVVAICRRPMRHHNIRKLCGKRTMTENQKLLMDCLWREVTEIQQWPKDCL